MVDFRFHLIAFAFFMCVPVSCFGHTNCGNVKSMSNALFSNKFA